MFKTTGVENTHLILAVNPFQVKVNNSFFILPLREKICRVSVPVESIIPRAGQEITGPTGTETLQIFSRMPVTTKKVKSCFPLLEKKYLLVLNVCLLRQLF